MAGKFTAQGLLGLRHLFHKPFLWLPPAFFLLIWIVGLLALPGGLGADDAGEYTTGAFFLGLTHMPAYPWFVQLGHAFSRLPISEPGFGLGLFAFLFYPAGFLLAAWDLLKEKDYKKNLSLLVAGLLLLACERVVFSSLNADVYGASFMGTVLLLRLLRKKQTIGLGAALGLVGLLFHLHPSSGLFAALLVGAALAQKHLKFSTKQALIGLALILLISTIELFLPLRGASDLWFKWASPITPDRWWLYKTTGPVAHHVTLQDAFALFLLGIKDLGAMGAVLFLGTLAGTFFQPKKSNLSPLLKLGTLGLIYLLLMAVLAKLPSTPFGQLAFSQLYSPLMALFLVVWFSFPPPDKVKTPILLALLPFAWMGFTATKQLHHVETLRRYLFKEQTQALPFESGFLNQLTSLHFQWLYQHGVLRQRADLEPMDTLGRIWEGGKTDTLRESLGQESVLSAQIARANRKIEGSFMASNLKWGAFRQSAEMGPVSPNIEERQQFPFGQLYLSPEPSPAMRVPDQSQLNLQQFENPQKIFGRDHLGKELFAFSFAVQAEMIEDKSLRSQKEKLAETLGHDSPLVLGLLGQLSLNNGDEFEARKRLTQALNMDPKQVANRISLGRLELLTGKYEQAKKLLEADLKAVKEFPMGKSLYGLTLIRLGNLALKDKKPKTAVSYYEKAKPLLAPTPQTLAWEGMALLENEEFLKAEKRFRSAIGLLDTSPLFDEKGKYVMQLELTTYLAWTLRKIGDYQEAVRLLEDLQKKRPFEEGIIKLAAEIYAVDLKDKKKAVGLYEQLARQSKDDRVREAATKMSQALRGGHQETLQSLKLGRRPGALELLDILSGPAAEKDKN